MRRSITTIGLGFLMGMVLAFLVFKAIKANNEFVAGKRSWLVCTRVNMRIISDAVESYVRTNKNTERVDLETLVGAGLLPKWSEIYICPGWFGIAPLRKNYDDSFFQSALRAPSPIAAYYTNCSYYVERVPSGFRVRCRYHTNELNYTIPMKIERVNQ